jgi:hypothetical protein
MAYLGQDTTAEALIPQIDRIEADTKSLTAGLSTAALQWRPQNGGWSIVQVLQHVTIANRTYFPVLRRLLDDAGPPPDGTPKPWRPSLSGRLLIWMLVPANERKTPTAGKLKPGPEPGPNPLNDYLATWRELTDIVWKAQGLDLNRLRFTSPVSSIVRGLNFGDGLVILVVHGQRHLKQIERVKASPGFPHSAA